GLSQSLGGVLSDGFEEPKTSARTVGNHRQERAFDELLEEIDDSRTAELVVGDDLFSCIGGKASGEDSQTSEHGPFVVVKEGVAPVGCGAEGPLTHGRCSRAANKDSELVVEPIGELRRREHTQPCRGELESQWDPIEGSADSFNPIWVVEPTVSGDAV